MTAGHFALDLNALNLHFSCPGHPLVWQNGYVALQRHVMSIESGRWLTAGEKVLSLNGDRTDGRPESRALVTAAKLRTRTLGEDGCR